MQVILNLLAQKAFIDSLVNNGENIAVYNYKDNESDIVESIVIKGDTVEIEVYCDGSFEVVDNDENIKLFNPCELSKMVFYRYGQFNAPMEKKIAEHIIKKFLNDYRSVIYYDNLKNLETLEINAVFARYFIYENGDVAMSYDNNAPWYQLGTIEGAQEFYKKHR